MRSNDIAIAVRNLSKSYRLFNHPGDRIKQFFSLGLRQYCRHICALDRVSFDIQVGQSVGIIGRNGSGKSTLLQLICGIVKPTAGLVETRGRISALLELGTGFNPEFTGRENVYFQGVLMGLDRAEMDKRFTHIARFAEIGEFIDEPVRTYSSGMFVRLAFAVLIHVDADILVVDEALGVGDELFQKRCFEKLTAILESRQKILIFVSHNVRQIQRLCQRAIWISHGVIAGDGPSDKICAAYLDEVNRDRCTALEGNGVIPNVAFSGEIEVLGLELTSGKDELPTTIVDFHGNLIVTVVFRCNQFLLNPEIIVGIQSAEGVFISSASTATLSGKLQFLPGEHTIRCSFTDLPLLPGAYQIRLGFLDRYRRGIWIGHMIQAFRVREITGKAAMNIPHGIFAMPFVWEISQGGKTD
jgi:ABC-type polysaccharide/polyol phosphate transport system ATPase subunit